MRATGAGAFVVAWINYIPDTNLGSIALREFDPRTQSFGEPLVVTEEEPAVTAGYRFELNGSGKGVIVWGEKVSLVTVAPGAPNAGEGAGWAPWIGQESSEDSAMGESHE